MKSKVAIIDPEIIEVNGVQYQPRPRSGKRMSKSMLSAILMAEAMSAGMGHGRKYERERPVVDIVEEYGRIQRKESKLSKNDRDWVESQFKNNYEKV